MERIAGAPAATPPTRRARRPQDEPTTRERRWVVRAELRAAIRRKVGAARP